MTRQVINVGATANDGTGDGLRTAYIKCNDNFQELYNTSLAPVAINNGTSNVHVYESANVTVSVAGAANVVNFSGSLTEFTGNVDISTDLNVGNSLTITQDLTIGDQLIISGTLGSDLIPDGNNTRDLGSNSARFQDIYLSGSSIVLGDIVLKASAGNILGVFGADGTTPGTINPTITNGTSSIDIPAANGDVQITANAITALTVSDAGANVIGYVDATGNIITVGNIHGGNILIGGLSASADVIATGNIQGMYVIGDGGFLANVTAASNVAVTQIANGTSVVGISSSGGNIEITSGGQLVLETDGTTVQFNVLTTYGAANLVTTGNVGGGNIIASGAFIGDGSQLTGIDATQIQNGTSSVEVVTSGGDIEGNVGGATIFSVASTGMTLSANIAMGSNNITGLADPVGAQDATTKSYVDSIAAAGIHYHDPVTAESVINLNATYNNGASGVGATLTNAGTQVAIVLDGITLITTDRVLVYQQTDASENGIYTVTNTGSASTNWVLTRATDADTWAASDPTALGQGDAFFVSQGSTGAGETYVMNTVGEIIFGTTDINFVQISTAAIYTANSGINLSGVTFSLDSTYSPTFAGMTVPSITHSGTTGVGNIGSSGSTFNTVFASTGTFTTVSGAGSSITALNASNLASGTVASARLTGAYSITAANVTSQSNSATITAASTNTANQIVLRDGSGAFSAGAITATGAGITALNASNLASGTVASARLSGAYAITAANVTSQSNSATIAAASINTFSTIVLRDASGNFSAGTITANGSGITALNASNISSGTIAAARVPTLNQNTTGSAATLTTARAIQVSGAVTGTANFDGSAAINIVTTIAANSVALGTDTTGNYVATGAVSGVGLSGSSSSEGGTFTVTSNATNLNTASTIVSRDASGNFTAGAITAGGILNGNANGVGNIGSSTGYFNTVFAKATSAQYADIAEIYASDADYAPGTVLIFGGSAEVTSSNEDASPRVAGVVSTNPAHLMNSNADGVAVALTGRVPTHVVGQVRKGDMMVATKDGQARAEANPAMGTVIGKALEDFNGTHGTIEVVVGRL